MTVSILYKISVDIILLLCYTHTYKNIFIFFSFSWHRSMFFCPIVLRYIHQLTNHPGGHYETWYSSYVQPIRYGWTFPVFLISIGWTSSLFFYIYFLVFHYEYRYIWFLAIIMFLLYYYILLQFVTLYLLTRTPDKCIMGTMERR